MKEKKVWKDSMDLYLRDISRIPLLSREEEFKVAKNIVRYRKEVATAQKRLKQNKSPAVKKKLKEAEKHLAEYRKKMIQSNYRLVVSIAKRYNTASLELMDIIIEGNLGLMEAIDKFNPDLGYRFSTFATWWIRQSIIKSLNDKGKIVRIPKYVEKSLSLLENQIEEYREIYGIDPDETTLSDMTYMSRKKIVHLRHVPTSFVSFDWSAADAENRISEILIDTHEESDPIQWCLKHSMKDTVNSLMDGLSDREASIIRMRYGLNGKDPMALEKIGEKIGLTRERVRQIHVDVLMKLREVGKKKNLSILLN